MICCKLQSASTPYFTVWEEAVIHEMYVAQLTASRGQESEEVEPEVSSKQMVGDQARYTLG